MTYHPGAGSDSRADTALFPMADPSLAIFSWIVAPVAVSRGDSLAVRRLGGLGQKRGRPVHSV